MSPDIVSHAIREHLEVLGATAFGAASLHPQANSAVCWTSVQGRQAFFAYSTKHFIDLANAVIIDVEAITAIRTAEVTAQRILIDRTQGRFGIWPPILAMAMLPVLPGSSTNAISNRTFPSLIVRRQNIRHRSRRKLAECGPRLGLGFRRRACGVASADARWSFA